MTAEPTAREREVLAAQEEQAELRKGATVAGFATYFGLPAACWAVVFLVSMYNEKTGGNLGWTALPTILVFIPAILGALVFSCFFLYEWLAIATLLTPETHRRKLHFLGAVALACLYTFVDGDPLSALRKTIVYLEHHGFFAIKLMIIGVIVGAFVYSFARTAELRDFPRYPLRWYGLLTIGSIVASATIKPEGDTSSKFHWYADTAYYTGTVIVSFIAFYFSARSGSRGSIAT